MRMLHLAILRCGSILVPRRQRADWIAEWTAELWYVSHAGYGTTRALAFCLGAYPDALWLRWNSPRPEARPALRLESPAQCIAILTALAAISVFFAFRLREVRNLLLPSPYKNPRTLAMIAPGKRFPARFPTVPIEEYRSLRNRAARLFNDLAYYRPAVMRVGPTELPTALASSNLFDLLEIPVASAPDRAPLVLTQTAWRKYFGSDPHLVGRVLEISGHSAVVTAIISDDSWRLPGQIDAWLLLDEQRLAALPPYSLGFVLARLANPAPRGYWRWRMKAGIECELAARRPPFLLNLLGPLIALLILPATTFLSLGEYPSGRFALRRWIFLIVKFALLIPIVFCGTLDLAAIRSTPIQAHGLVIGYVLAFRWALIDQRKRCPVCLRLLTHPTRIGWASQTFLEWYGTELMCARGHGLMHVPEIRTSCYAQRWMYLDASWSGLFSAPERLPARHA